MQCMEVWSGSQLTAQGVAFAGLDAWVYSKPYGGAKHGGQTMLTAPSPKLAKRSAAPVPPPRAVSDDEKTQALRLLERGNAQIRAGSMIAARSLLERAVDLGSAEAAMALAATYDAWELARLGVLGVQPNPELARKWYARAQALGAPAAIERLARLPKQ